MPLDLTTLQVTDLALGVHRVARNLYLHNRPPARSWVMIYTSPLTGRRVEMGLGSTELLTVAQAKALVLRHRVAILEGRCPLVERRASRAARKRPEAVSFRDAADHFIKAHAGSWRSGEHARQWTVTLSRHVFPVMGAMPVGAVGTGEVMQVLEPMWHAKPETASRIRGRIEQVLDYATSRGWRHGDNPARWRGHIANLLPSRAKLMPTQHLAALPWRELPDLWRDLSNLTTIPALALRFVLLTCVRTGEAMEAKWAEFDLDQRVWTVPAERMKGARVHRVPLSGAAVEVLDRLSELRMGEHLFPGARHGRPIAGSRALLVLRNLRGPGATVHGFRSGFRDWASEHGVAGEAAEAVLAHAINNKVEAAYRRSDLLEPRRAVMVRWGLFLAGGHDAKR